MPFAVIGLAWFIVWLFVASVAEGGKEEILKALKTGGWPASLGLVGLLAFSCGLIVIYQRYGLVGGGIVLLGSGLAAYCLFNYWLLY